MLLASQWLDARYTPAPTAPINVHTASRAVTATGPTSGREKDTRRAVKAVRAARGMSGVRDSPSAKVPAREK
jgi:hypothetical protein